MKQLLYSMAFIFMGFVLNPTAIYACSKTVAIEKSCCALTNKKVKTKEHTCSHHKKGEKSCQGNCDNNGCRVTTIFSSILPNNYILKMTSLLFLERATTFSYLEKSIGIPYFSVWSPPKIS